MTGPDGLPVAVFAFLAAWVAWLGDHHVGSGGLWLKISKRGRDVSSVTNEEALLGPLAFGWIDGQKAPLDEAWWLQRFTPRKPRSRWSKANRDRAERLIAEGAMQPAGLRQVELARADGRWDPAHDSQRAATVPDDLRAALAANPAAEAFFATLDATNRYAVLYRLSGCQGAGDARRIRRARGLRWAGGAETSERPSGRRPSWSRGHPTRLAPATRRGRRGPVPAPARQPSRIHARTAPVRGAPPIPPPPAVRTR